MKLAQGYYYPCDH